MPDAKLLGILQPKNDCDNGVMCKSFYQGNGLKTGSKTKKYLTPLERKAIRDLRKIVLENKLIEDIVTPVKENVSEHSHKPKMQTAKKLLSVQRGASGGTIKNPLSDEFKSGISNSASSTPRVSTPKKPKRTSKGPTYSWAPNSLKSQYLKAQWKFEPKKVTIPSYKTAENKMNRSLPSKPSFPDKKEGYLDEDAKSQSFSTDHVIDDEGFGNDGPPTKMRKTDDSDDNVSPPSTLSTSFDSMEENVEQLTLEANDKGSENKFYPIFMKRAKSQTPTKKAKSTPHENAALPVTVGNVAVATPVTKTRSKKANEDSNGKQLIIDAGQKRFGATHCSMCGMVYSANHPGDEQEHAIYHKSLLNFIRFSGWKNERLVTSFMDGRIIKVLPNDPKYATKKVTDILTIVDTDLGFKAMQSGLTSSKTAYLFVSNEEKIVGCLIAEKISMAFRLLHSDTKENASVMPSESIVCFSAAAPTSAVCGVSRIWTYSPMRRMKIATRLLDTVRLTFMLGSALDINQVAFSDPTPDGRAFATNYFKRPDILVYNNLTN